MKKIKVKVIKIGIKNGSEPDKRILYASFTPSIEYKGDERRKVSLNYPYYKNLKFKGRAHGMEDITNDDERHGANESKREESQGNYLWATAIANDIQKQVNEHDYSFFDSKIIKKEETDGLTFIDAVRELEKERGDQNELILPESTLMSVDSLVKQMNEYSPNTLCSEINTTYMAEFKRFLLQVDRKLKPTTAQLYFRSLKTTIKKMSDCGLYDFQSNISSYKSITVEKSEIEDREYLEGDDLRDMIAYDHSNIVGLSDGMRQGFLFACYTGLRASDVKRLKWANLKVRNGKRFLHTVTKKTGKTIRFELPEVILDLLPEQSERNELVFKGYDYSRRHNDIWTQWAFNSGVESQYPDREKIRITSHVARHTCAGLLLSAGQGLDMVAKVLGITLQSAEVYGDIWPDAVTQSLELALKQIKVPSV